MEIVVSEDFSMTPAMQSALDAKMKKIHRIVGEDSLVRVYVSKEGKSGDCKVTFHVVLYQKEITATAVSNDYYKAVNECKAKFLRQVTDAHNQVVQHHN